jgi:hypothetical protein
VAVGAATVVAKDMSLSRSYRIRGWNGFLVGTVAPAESSGGRGAKREPTAR